MNNIIRVFLVFLSCVIFIELTLRMFGFCSAPLYYSSPKFEYLPLPNQDGKRFGNSYFYNEFSQRSGSPSKKKKRILAIGDSVINGGAPTDQDSLATTILTETTSFQWLNISAGSWGPDNIAAYLSDFGTFEAAKMILVCSSHDSHDNMDFNPVVGVHPSYPNNQYSLAILELFDRYLLPRIFCGNGYQGNENVIKNGLTFNSGFESLLKIASRDGIDFIIYLHPEQSEIEMGKYHLNGVEIIEWAEKHNVILIKGLDNGFLQNDFRDNIHLNEKGQRKLAVVLKERLNL